MGEPLLVKDEKGRWYFSRGKHESEFLIDVADEDRQYLEWLIEEDRGALTGEGVKAIQEVL